jgi:hypothetical protein
MSIKMRFFYIITILTHGLFFFYSALKDKERYDQEMSLYKAPPDKMGNQKRSKNGYNMFFSAHVLRLKETEEGVPSERGSVARIVGIAWKDLTSEERAYYDCEADKYNNANGWKDGEEDVDDDEIEDANTMMKRQQQQQQQFQIEQYQLHHTTTDPHLHALHVASIQHGQQHDPRHHPYFTHPHVYSQPPPYGHFDFSQHRHHQHARASGYPAAYAISGRHLYEGAV